LRDQKAFFNILLVLGPMGRKLDNTLAVLNGLIGDYLVRTENGLATGMSFYRNGRVLEPTREAWQAAHPAATDRICVLVHGIMCDETFWSGPDGSDYGALLERDFGYTPLYLRYNTGRPIADNGRALQQLMAAVVSVYPVPIREILLVGYSMGGLLIRSACHFAAQEDASWLGLVRRAIYIGTPHAGAPAERVGRLLARVLTQIDDPYTKLIAEIGNLRSAGLRDLGDGDLRHEDRALQGQSLSLRDARHPVPLLASMQHYLIAGSLFEQRYLAALFGDSLVPVSSATARRLRLGQAEAIPAEHVRVLPGLGHFALARHPEVYAQIKAWCEEEKT
jgi:triacylglycerol lipase